MIKNYEVGMDNNEITLEVTVGTEALAQSVAYLAGATSSVLIAESTLDDGNISAKKIGTGAEVRQKVVSVTTTIDCKLLPAEQWPTLLANLAITYVLNGGVSGRQDSKPDPDDIRKTESGRFITVTKGFYMI
jgi:hypothetical protein